MPATLPIIIDTREQRPWSFDAAKFTVSRAKLATGDYTISGIDDRIVLERKSLDDAVQSFIHNWIRFKKELIRLSAYDAAAIVIEANLEDIATHQYQSGVTPASIIGKANAIFLDHGIPVFFWGNHDLAGRMAARLLTKAWERWGQQKEQDNERFVPVVSGTD